MRSPDGLLEDRLVEQFEELPAEYLVEHPEVVRELIQSVSTCHLKFETWPAAMVHKLRTGTHSSCLGRSIAEGCWYPSNFASALDSVRPGSRPKS